MGALGLRLIGVLLEEKTFKPLRDKGIRPSFLFDEARVAYDWVTEYQAKYKRFPTSQNLYESTGIVAQADDDCLEYLAEKVRSRKLTYELSGMMEEVGTKLRDRDPQAALDLINNHSVHLKEKGVRPHQITGMLSEESTFIEEYKNRMGILNSGVPTPWEWMNEKTGGWGEGEFSAIVASANVGKTWACVHLAEEARKSDKKILLVSMEMSKERIEKRLHAMHYQLPLRELNKNELNYFALKRWEKQWAEEIKDPVGDILVVDKKTIKYVGDIRSLTYEQEPDLVIIDGGYRLRSHRPMKNSWEEAKEIIEGMQIAAELTGVPWISTSQQGAIDSKSKLTREDRQNKVRYAREWFITPDTVLEMVSNEDLRDLKVMQWNLLKWRDGDGGGTEDSFFTNWDLENWDFSETSNPDPAEAEYNFHDDFKPSEEAEDWDPNYV